MICMKEGCCGVATKQAHMRLFTVQQESAAPIPGDFGLVCCYDHATDEAGRAVLNENEHGRKQIEIQFQQSGLAAPDWNRSYVLWVTIPTPKQSH